MTGFMHFIDKKGSKWRIADIADIPFPTTPGGKTSDCPLDDISKRAYKEKGDNVTGDEVLDALKKRESEVRKCWHHRLRKRELFYVAELSCRLIEQRTQPVTENIEPLVKLDGFSTDVQYAVEALFEDPLFWSFTKEAKLGNGQHRLCALKAYGVPRVAVEA